MDAQIEISSIGNYIWYNLCNPIAAINYMEKIYNKIYSLKIFPYRGLICSDKYNRRLIYKKYLIFYEIREKEKSVIIRKVIHSNINKHSNY